MANKQWNDPKYLTAATTVISNIYSHEVSGDLLVGGDQWTGINPSYMSMVATELFKSVDGSKWSAVQTRCYQLLASSQHSTTGMWPNWCNTSGNPGGGVGDFQEIYGFDACRTPWRLGWAYAWYGHADAKARCTKIVDWFKTHTSDAPSSIGQKYNLDGSINSSAGGNTDNIPTYLGPLTIGGMVDSKFQSWVDKGYTRMRAFGGVDDNYYNECLELLSMLLLTGNMPNLTVVQPKSSATLTVNVNPPGAGTASASPAKGSYTIGEAVNLSTSSSNSSRYTFMGWTGDYVGSNPSASINVKYDMVVTANYKDNSAADLVDDCEDGNGLTLMGSEWFSYTDAADNGASTITPVTVRNTTLLTMTSGGYNSSNYAVKIQYTLNQGSFEYDPFVGIGFDMNREQTSVNISSATGISFAYKGTFKTGECALKIESDAVTELGASYSYTLEPSTGWKEVSLTWDEFLQPAWAEAVDLDLTRVPKIQWQIQGLTGASGEFWIDDIHLIGYDVPTKASPKSIVQNSPGNMLNCVQKGSDLTVNFSTKRSGMIRLSLYDLTGRLVITPYNDFRNAGTYSTHINTRENGLSNSGGYVLHMSTADGSLTRKLIINR